MNKSIPFCILMSALAFGASSCSDEVIGGGEVDIEKTHGQEVSFNVSAESYKTEKSRTYFGDRDGDTYPIYWASLDNIVVGSPMGMADHDTAVYHIVVPTLDGKPYEGGASYAKEIELNTEYCKAGIQWGNNTELGSFYAIYPFCAETLRRPENLSTIPRYYNSINTKDATHGDSVTATAKVENVQRIWAPNGTAAKNGLLNMHGSNHAHVMWAQTDGVKQGESVNLRFKPLSTCLMMTFSCATGADGNYFPATIEKITIDTSTSTDAPYIAGNMTIDFPDAYAKGVKVSDDNKQYYNGDTPECTLIDGTGSRTIEILPWIRSNDVESGIHPTINPGEKMQVCAFLLPTDDIASMSDWTITVQVSGSTYSLKMDAAHVGGNLQIEKGQIHEITFPAFNVTEAWDFNPNSWMADIPNNTYLSQITFPGAWEAWTVSTNDGLNYQTGAFKELMTVGIRAFDFKTCTRNNTVVMTGTGGEQVVSEVIAQVAQHVRQKAPTETMMMVFRYEPDSDGGSNDEDYAYWLKGLYEAYNTAKVTYGDILYDGAITPETTIGEVRGRVLMKVNLDDDICKNWATEGTNMYGNNLPALISYSPLKWVTEYNEVVDVDDKPVDPEDYTDTSLTSVLQWKEWTGKWNFKLINDLPADRPELYAWNFSCTNRTYNGTGSTTINDLPTMGLRQGALDKLKKEAIDVYNEGYHNEWFLFGCGGTYATSTTSTIEDKDIESFTSNMNTWLNNKVDSIFILNTPCPLGIVFYNHVCGVTYGMDENWNPTTTIDGGAYHGIEILTNLIKINKAFYLQQKPETAQSETPASAPAMRKPKEKTTKPTIESNGWTVTKQR